MADELGLLRAGSLAIQWARKKMGGDNFLVSLVDSSIGGFASRSHFKIQLR
jgi:hypothetical protein